METPYYRPELMATRAGVADPLSLVDLWLDQLLVFMSYPEDDRWYFYDILALFGRLERTAPELLAQLGEEAVQKWEKARADILARKNHFLEMACTCPSPTVWLDEADNLASATDDGEDPDILSDWSAALLNDLDDMDVYHWLSGAEKDDGLEKCHAWLAENTDRFFPVGVLVQGMAAALKPDLIVFDHRATLSADKFIVLLDALEEVEAELNR